MYAAVSSGSDYLQFFFRFGEVCIVFTRSGLLGKQCVEKLEEQDFDEERVLIAGGHRAGSTIALTLTPC